MPNATTDPVLETTPGARRHVAARSASGAGSRPLEDLAQALAACSALEPLGRALCDWLERTFDPEICTVLMKDTEQRTRIHGDVRAHALGTGERTGWLVLPIRRADRRLGRIQLKTKQSLEAGERAILSDARLLVGAEMDRIQAQVGLECVRTRLDDLARYVPNVISRRILRGEDVTAHECDVAILFLDIRGYTAHTATLRCSQVFRLLNGHVRTVSSIIQRHGGTIVEFNGDGLMAVFGAPERLPCQERAALESGLELAEAVPMLLASQEDPSVPLGIGIGIASGPAYVGAIASEDRLIWSAVGKTTNLASRLEAMTREFDTPLVVDAATFERAGIEDVRFATYPGTHVRGLSDPVDVHVLRRTGRDAR